MFHILKKISQFHKTVTLDDTSIEKACGVINKHFGLDDEARAKLKVNKNNGETQISLNVNTTTFLEKILGFDKLPAHLYEGLMDKVNKDLLEISELIKWYEEQPCILKYIKNGDNPKNHKDRITYDFYKRCLLGRVEILNYQLYNLKEDALNQSKHSFGLFSDFLRFSSFFNAQPYYFASPFSIHYFDCRKIDLVGHRLGEYYIQDARMMEKLYYDNKPLFYRKYFKRSSAQKQFQDTAFYLQFLPLKNNRNLIFNELQRLFKAKRWIGFYALALPQVEGLFSEMCQVAFPGNDFSQHTLTQKVNSLRPFHSLSNSYFDYFQYHIPLQRNKFAHTGFDEDFKLKSFDLLVDLTHLLQIFYELEHPLVKIKKLHTMRSQESFISIKKFTEYFEMLNLLKDSQRNEIQNEIQRFERDFLTSECQIEYFCNELITNLEKILSDVLNHLNDQFADRNLTMTIKELSMLQINELFKIEDQADIINWSFAIKSENVELLGCYYVFLSNYKKHLPSLKKEIKDQFVKVELENMKALKVVFDINSMLIKRRENMQ